MPRKPDDKLSVTSESTTQTDRCQLDIWRLRLTRPGVFSDRDLSSLSSSEHQRAAAYRVDGARHTFTVARLLLRRVLAERLGCSPAAVTINGSLHEKPHCPDGPHFNLSHSREHLVLAVCNEHALGVDVESHGITFDVIDMSRSCFSIAEQQALLACSRDDRERAFLAGWTRKEAILKGLGCGLQLPLAAFDVSLKTNDTQALRASRDQRLLAADWQLRALTLFEDAEAALAVKTTLPLSLQINDVDAITLNDKANTPGG